jgi:hypothetical protein
VLKPEGKEVFGRFNVYRGIILILIINKEGGNM